MRGPLPAGSWRRPNSVERAEVPLAEEVEVAAASEIYIYIVMYVPTGVTSFPN